MTSLSLLIVDDDFLFTDMLPRQLAKSVAAPRMEVSTATSPRTGADLVRERHFDVLLCDYDLKATETGLAVLAVAASDAPRTLRVLITDHSLRDVEIPDAGLVQALIEKPMTLREVVPMITDLFEQALGIDVDLKQ